MESNIYDEFMIKKYEILKLMYDECFFIHSESIRLSLIMNKKITTYSYFFILLKQLINEGLIEKYVDEHKTYVNLTKKGKKKVEAYIELFYR